MSLCVSETLILFTVTRCPISLDHGPAMWVVKIVYALVTEERLADYTVETHTIGILIP